MKEIAATIVILKNRHRSSIRFINHLCYFLKILHIQHFPANFRTIVNLLSINLPMPSLETMFICSCCYTKSTSSSHCDRFDCPESKRFTRPPFQFSSIPIRVQMEAILSQAVHLNLNHQCGSGVTNIELLKDVSDGDFYQEILKNENSNFISLIMNVDGVQISDSSTTSLWISTFVINEIPRKHRFKVNNVLVGGVLTAPCKPSHKVMDIFMRATIDEFIELERAHSFTVREDDAIKNISLKVFIIGACCDKPAESLLQGKSEATGAFGCSRCEIEGELLSFVCKGSAFYSYLGITVLTQQKSKKKIRVFPLISTDQSQPRLRSNQTYDELINANLNGHRRSKIDDRNQRRGQIFTCTLRQLTYFDVGRCFLTDSLHNIYHGVVVSYLHDTINALVLVKNELLCFFFSSAKTFEFVVRQKVSQRTMVDYL